MAAISPIWFDWFGPGTFIAQLCSLSSSNHIPLPHWAFSLPLLRHDPSVYTVIPSSGIVIPRGGGFLVAGSFIILFGSTKILKQSARFVFMVTDGLKTTPGLSSSPLSSSSASVALVLLSLVVLEPVRLSWLGGRSGCS